MYETEKKENLRKHWMKHHLEEAVNEGLVKQRKKKNYKLNGEDLNQVKDMIGNLDESATFSDFSTGKQNPKHGDLNVPFLKLCIPSTSGREMNMEKTQAIKSFSDLFEKHKDDVLFNSIQSMYKSLESQGFTQEQIKPIIKESIKQFKSTSSTHGFEEKIEHLSEEFKSKLNVWDTSLTTKIQELNSLLQSSNNTFTNTHTILSQELDNMYNVEQLDNELIYAEFYYMKAMMRR